MRPARPAQPGEARLYHRPPPAGKPTAPPPPGIGGFSPGRSAPPGGRWISGRPRARPAGVGQSRPAMPTEPPTAPRYDIQMEDKFGALRRIDIPAEAAQHQPWF